MTIIFQETPLKKSLLAVALLSLSSAALADPRYTGYEPGETRAIQSRLNELHFDVDVDGDFGPRTRAAITAFQRAVGLIPDGEAGPRTMDALFGRTPREVEPQYGERREERDEACGGYAIEVAAERFLKSRSLNAARKAWEAKVFTTEGLGPRYGDWDAATDKSEECLPASAGAKFTWNCTVRARPCKAH